MSLQWEPQWVDETVEYAGMRLRVKRDKVTGLYACPVCGLGDNATYLLTVKDLFYHIYAHARRAERYRARVQYEEEEGHEEE